jgi:hypothetical protein
MWRARGGRSILLVALVETSMVVPPGMVPAVDATAGLREEFSDAAGVPIAYRLLDDSGSAVLPPGDAVLLDEQWWTPLRPLAELVTPPPAPAAQTLRLVRAEVAPPATARQADHLLAVGLGDVTGDGAQDLVVSFRRPFRRTLINSTRARRYWVDAHGESAHVGVYRPEDLHHIWIAGTLVRPIEALAVCDGALAVAYGYQRRPGAAETGAWLWAVFGFLPTRSLPGPGTPVCVDIDQDGRTEPAIMGRSQS